MMRFTAAFLVFIGACCLTGRAATEETLSGEGQVLKIDEHSMIVEADDSRFFELKLSNATKYSGPSGALKITDIDIGARVRFSATQREEDIAAATVTLLKPPPKSADNTAEVKQAEDADKDRPRLHHGPPEPRKQTAEDMDVAPATSEDDVARITAHATPAAGAPREELQPRGETDPSKPLPLIEQAREQAADFEAHLPNFVCQQFTTRYGRESKSSGWQAQDVVSATVVYSDGHEQYQDVKVGNKKVSGDYMEAAKGGQRSTGEFGSILASLMARRTRADFQPDRSSVIHQIAARAYTFKVGRENSDWRVMVSGQDIIPGYSGTVWIAKDTGRVLRLERQADDIPEAFPMDIVEQTLDYDNVLIGNQKVMLPVESENLSCQRGTPICSKNVIEFRNYREFRGETSIQFDK